MIYWPILAPILFFCVFLINPARSYPMIPFIIFLEIIIFSRNISRLNFLQRIRELIIIFIPFVLLLLFGGAESIFYKNILDIIKSASQGNIQLFLAPFTTFGS